MAMAPLNHIILPLSKGMERIFSRVKVELFRCVGSSCFRVLLVATLLLFIACAASGDYSYALIEFGNGGNALGDYIGLAWNILDEKDVAGSALRDAFCLIPLFLLVFMLASVKRSNEDLSRTREGLLLSRGFSPVKSLLIKIVGDSLLYLALFETFSAAILFLKMGQYGIVPSMSLAKRYAFLSFAALVLIVVAVAEGAVAGYVFGQVAVAAVVIALPYLAVLFNYTCCYGKAVIIGSITLEQAALQGEYFNLAPYALHLSSLCPMKYAPITTFQYGLASLVALITATAIVAKCKKVLR